MAVSQTDKSSQISINVEVATDTYKDRTFKYINPELTDEKAYSVTMLFAGLQAHYVNKIKRRNEYTIVEHS